MPKYAVLDNIDLEKWRGHEEVSMHRLAPEGSTWDVYRCYRSELPDLDALDQFTGVFVSGSHCSADDSETWIQQEEAWLQAFANRKTSCKMFASCFGCQLLAKALGGEVGKNPSGDFVLTVETMDGTKALLSQPFFQATAAQHKIGQTIKIIQSHGEQILALPKGAELLATSPTAPFEAWSYGPNILALQGHCEFDAKTTLEKIHATLTNNGRLTPEQSHASSEALHNIAPDDAFVTDMIKLWWSQPCAASSSQSAASASQSAAAAATAAAAASAAASASAPPASASGQDTAEVTSTQHAQSTDKNSPSKQQQPPLSVAAQQGHHQQQGQSDTGHPQPELLSSEGHSQPQLPPYEGHPQPQLPPSEGQTSSLPTLSTQPPQQQSKSQLDGVESQSGPLQQPQQPFATLTAGHPQAAGIDALAHELQADAHSVPSGTDPAAKQVSEPSQGTDPNPSTTPNASTHPNSSSSEHQNLQQQALGNQTGQQPNSSSALTPNTADNAVYADYQQHADRYSSQVNSQSQSSNAEQQLGSNSAQRQSAQPQMSSHSSAAKASEGWQHYSASSDACNALGANDRAAPKQELRGWVDEVITHEDRLSHKAQALMTELAAVVAAETASSTADYKLVANMNGLMQKQYAEMLTFVEGLRPQIEDLLVCQEAAQPVLEAIAKLEKNVDAIEDAITGLELDSKQLLQQFQLL